MEYRDWMNQNWMIAGGLITQAQAAKMLKKTPTRIRQMINEKKLTGYQYEQDAPLLSFSEITRIGANAKQ